LAAIKKYEMIHKFFETQLQMERKKLMIYEKEYSKRTPIPALCNQSGGLKSMVLLCSLFAWRYALCYTFAEFFRGCVRL